MDKIKIVAKILEECAEHGHPLSAGQVDIILDVLGLSEYEKDCVAGELLAWRTEHSPLNVNFPWVGDDEWEERKRHKTHLRGE